MKHPANLITGVRLAAAPLLLLTKPLTPSFYALYLLGGVSDMADGAVARKTGSESELGKVLDSLADLAFVLACCMQLLPMMDLPTWLWVWAGIIALIRLINLLCGYLYRRRLVLLHTAANRLTGLLLFLLPLAMGFTDITYPAAVVAAAATFAAAQEGHFIRTGR